MPAKKKLLRRLILAGAAVLLVCALAILFALEPFAMLLPAYALPKREEGELRLHFLDVGQGDCTLIEFPDGEVLAVDGGDGSFSCTNKLARYLKALSPARLSLLVTHADVDHFGAFPFLLKEFEVETCYLPLLPVENAAYSELLSALGEARCKTDVLTRYDRMEKKEGYLVCLSPRSQEEDDENDTSTVLYLNFGGVRILLCGDISSSREKLLLREYALMPGIFNSGDCAVDLDKIDILKAPHHGSEGSSSLEFLSLLRPQSLIVTCGKDNGYHFPKGGALENFRAASPEGKIYRTDEQGDIIVSVKDASYSVLAREEL